ncbi:MAG: glycosyltransferase family 2 protein [Methanomassiliicoccales archaeon]|nr:glycosyltransferase family 2 protein [Methanomassiliicoccales archaeon]
MSQEGAALVSVIVPTLNEEASLPICLRSVRSQTWPGIELLIVDSGSKDRTREIANEFGATLVDYPGRLMGARKKGVEACRGDLVLFLDGDQVLYTDTVERAVRAIAERDMLVLEETSYEPKGWLQKSLCRQKAALHRAADREKGFGPNLYPRFFRRDLLLEAYEGLDEATMSKVFAYEDGLLFRRTYAVSKRVAILDRGVMHMEEKGWLWFMRHAYGAGKSSKSVRMEDLEGDLGRAEPVRKQLARAAKGRYLTLSLVKETCFRLGRLAG